ncbi:protein YIP5 [Trichinella spiralis]|uniref:protein YIP5 n=1 Tax=Trichinella spiralis TaxID=6334 RepID=UPI0001EFBB88|nr:protein YIP5 [Trichinella spiralis]XP_003368726.1 protein YIP5 [Trichinella spiralis]XP_003368879.1 protein YIP5 [Trichinella spiralis]XP_003370904.1 protein YIP5 [Trichinella spiralis]XP_003371024.1 protein YIP5 [Trichinella spiralis]XP_003381455.1 protein YIP5 [Trichinella spiralis]
MVNLKDIGTSPCSFDDGTMVKWCKRVNGFREVLSFVDLEVEYNGNVENNGQTLLHGVVVIAEPLAHCLMLYS